MQRSIADRRRERYTEVYVRFRTQLVTGFASILVVTVLSGAAAVVALRGTCARLERVSRELASNVVAIEQLHVAAEEVVSTSRGYLLTGTHDARTQFTRSIGVLDGTIHQLVRRGARPADLAIAIATARAYVAVAQEAAERRDQTDDPRALLAFNETQLRPMRERFEQATAMFAAHAQTAFEHAARRSERRANDVQVLLLITTAVGVGLGLAVALLAIRRLGSQFASERDASARANRAVASREELLAIVSHDLRAPLTAITLAADLMAEEAPARPLHAITSAAHHMSALIDLLLEAARLDSGKLELHRTRQPIASVLAEASHLYADRAREAQIALAVEVPRDLVVFVDPARCTQVVSNLIGNALKYTPHGGRIDVRVTPLPGFVRIAVTDTGPGIPAEQLPHVFERHWQSRPSGAGSLGLGLYICKRIVEAGGGTIGADSIVGEGSTFWFTVPRPAEKPFGD